jgi:hypothetical protein
LIVPAKSGFVQVRFCRWAACLNLDEHRFSAVSTLDQPRMYAAGMEIYNVDLTEAMANRHRRVRMFFILFACFAPSYFALEWLWRSHSRPTVTAMAIQAIFFSLVMSAIQSSRSNWLSASESWSTYQIVVSDDEIVTRNFNSFSRLYSKTIRRGEIRTVIEKEQGLLISRRGRAATRYFFGGIWIPKQLADYEYLKRLVLSWRPDQLPE